MGRARGGVVAVLGAVVMLVAVLPTMANQIPGDVNGDGVLDAGDVACANATIFDDQMGCATLQHATMQNVLHVNPDGVGQHR